ncbi:MAG TPA: DUF4307 domain-containing protein [Candidatus Saccharimonadales bacterium]|nr:DUF4307 domain-containing protein [Candidatus Saccharimonadales bacterium]
MEESTVRPKQTNKWTKKSKIIVGSLFALFLLVVIIISTSGGAKASYQVTDIKPAFVDDQTVSVSFRVKNIGNADGTPYCQVNAHDPSSDYYGGNSGKMDSSIKAGDSTSTTMAVTITKQGAQYVTTADVRCY